MRSYSVMEGHTVNNRMSDQPMTLNEFTELLPEELLDLNVQMIFEDSDTTHQLLELKLFENAYIFRFELTITESIIEFCMITSPNNNCQVTPDVSEFKQDVGYIKHPDISFLRNCTVRDLLTIYADASQCTFSEQYTTIKRDLHTSSVIEYLAIKQRKELLTCQ